MIRNPYMLASYGSWFLGVGAGLIAITLLGLRRSVISHIRSNPAGWWTMLIVMGVNLLLWGPYCAHDPIGWARVDSVFVLSGTLLILAGFFVPVAMYAQSLSEAFGSKGQDSASVTSNGS